MIPTEFEVLSVVCSRNVNYSPIMMHFKDLSKQIYGLIYSVELTCFERKHWRLLSLEENHVRDG